MSRKGEFARTNEYIFIISIGDSAPVPLKLDSKWIGEIKNLARKNGLRWNTLLRSGSHVLRSDSPNQFYPIFVTKDGKKIMGVGEPYYGNHREEISAPEGCVAIWPIRQNGEEGNWQVSKVSFIELVKKGYVRLGRFNERGTIAIDYLKRGEIEKINNGTFSIKGYTEAGFIIVDDSGYEPTFVPGCQWNIPTHDATQQGTKMLDGLIGKRFSYPKSLYAVHDAIRFFVANKPNALIVDFFAGSGTTLHAVNLLNAEDGGNRRCIVVTNNEVSADEAKDFLARDIYPNDDEWNAKGIARYVTWPRTTCSIKGVDVNGKPLEGKYIDTDINMSDGFKANAVFYHLGFLDKNSVALGRQFKELLPLLWLKAGAVGECPKLPMNQPLPPMMIRPENKFAVLIDEIQYNDFMTEVNRCGDVETVYIVTDSDAGYREMAGKLKAKNTYQLYRDYLDNFRINRAAR